jgi:hypothetical protein
VFGATHKLSPNKSPLFRFKSFEVTMSSGVAADTEVIDISKSFVNGEARKKYAFISCKISDDLKSIQWCESESLTKENAKMLTCCDQEEAEKMRYECFRNRLSLDTPRWYIYDCYKVMEKDGARKAEKVIWIHW